jgi:hypothetical protein
MRRATLLLTVGLVAATVFVAFPAQAKTTVAFSAEFKETFGNAQSKPCQHFLCGTGTVSGFGAATSAFDLTFFEPIEGTNCADFEADRVITLVSDGSTLTLDEVGTVCFPGNSFFTPGSQQSFGNPARLDATWTVDRGTGVFRNARGEGTDINRNSGDEGHSSLRGTLTLP